MQRWPKIYHFWSMVGYHRCAWPIRDFSFVPKVKLDGVNTGINIKPTGEWFAQSRNHVITPDNDLYGFAAWAYQHSNYWRSLSKILPNEFTIFGEWYGEGIQTGSTASKVPGRHWGIFAIGSPGFSAGRLEIFMMKPETLYATLPNLPASAYVIPTLGKEIIVKELHDETEVSEALNRINEMVAEVGERDPLIYSRHGIEGPGEGLVFSWGKENSTVTLTPKDCIFKRKPEASQVIKDRENKMAINVRTIPEFADYMLTEERLMHCAQSVAKNDHIFDEKLIGPFVAGILKDVKKEAKPIVESNGVRWRKVSQEVSKQAKEWYMEKLEDHTLH